MSYGTLLNLSLPTLGGTMTESQAATLINAAFQAIEDRLEQKVSPASMDINADVSFQSGVSFYGAKDLHRATFASQSAALSTGTYPVSLYVVNGELYYNDANGNQVNITTGGQLNFALAGGVTGSGYGASGKEVNWDNVNSIYRMRKGTAADDFARITVDDVLFNDGSGNYATLGAPSLTADYTMLLPTALPAAGTAAIMSVDSTGQIAHSKTPTVDALTVTSNGHVTVAGTGRFKHGAMQQGVEACAGHSSSANYASGAWSFPGSAASVQFPVLLPLGARITSVDVLSNQVAAGTRTLRLQIIDNSTGAPTNITSVNNTSTSGVSLRAYNLADSVLSANNMYRLTWESSNSDVLYGLVINYDMP